MIKLHAVWRQRHSNKYFVVERTCFEVLLRSSGQFQIAQNAAGSWPFVVTSAPNNAAVVQGMGKADTLRVQTKGNTAWLYINNQLVNVLSGTAPAGGGVVGFYAQSDSSLTAKETWQVSNLTVAVQQCAALRQTAPNRGWKRALV